MISVAPSAERSAFPFLLLFLLSILDGHVLCGIGLVRIKISRRGKHFILLFYFKFSLDCPCLFDIAKSLYNKICLFNLHLK